MLSYSSIPYAATGRFSALVCDYLAGSSQLQDFYDFSPDAEGLDAAFEERKAHPVDRQLLSTVLKDQYRDVAHDDAVSANLDGLQDENTFTVCTAHQPNLGTGYLYFVYKILHAIRLAQTLQERHPDHRFIPVYYMGSEDNDLEELGTFRYEGRKYIWDAAGQTGAVGRMRPEGLKPLLDDLFRVMGPPSPNLDALQEMLTEAYLKHDTIAAATRYLVNALFGRYGLLVLDSDDERLKRSFIPVMQDDLLNSRAESLIHTRAATLADQYGLQAAPRPINLFYLKDNIRERIERQDSTWIVLNTHIQWTKEALLEELNSHPERFSPNVVLRPLFQETIMPNVAFIGGGAEVAYWLELKAVFNNYKVFYPAILLRQSIWWVDASSARRLSQLGLDATELFEDRAQLERRLVDIHAPEGWDTSTERDALEYLMDAVREKAISVDSTLEAATDSAMKKMNKLLMALEGKMARAYKKQISVPIGRLQKVLDHAFPNGGLQERVENFMGYYLKYGPSWFDALLEGIDPLDSQFLIVAEEDHMA